MIDYSKLFVKDQYGSEVFYPWGVGKGYTVHSSQKRDEILRIMQGLNKVYISLGVLVIPFAIFCAENDVSVWAQMGTMFLACILCTWAYYKRYLYPNIQDLPKSSSKIRAKDIFFSQIMMMSLKYYIMTTFFFSVAFISFLYFFQKIDFFLLTLALLFFICGSIRVSRT